MSSTAPKITRSDLEHKFRALQDGTKAKAVETQATAVKVGAGLGVLFLIIVFLLGQRRGTRKTTLVEIRRY